MATLAAVNQVGESIAAMLRSRRDLLAAAGQLAPVPAALHRAAAAGAVGNAARPGRSAPGARRGRAAAGKISRLV